MVTDKATDAIPLELSIIIPTYNRVERLRACLKALCRQTQSASDFEVIVVVDGSTDGTREMLESFATPFELQVLYQDNSGQCVARNRGIAAACGRYCLFLDDDIIATTDLVAEHLRVQREHGGVVGIGQLTLKQPPHADWFARRFNQMWNDHYARLNQGIQKPSWKSLYSGNFSAPREALGEVGGFAEDLSAGFDIELGYHLDGRGLPFTYIPRALGEQDDYKDFVRLSTEIEKQASMSNILYHRHPAMLPMLLEQFGEGNSVQAVKLLRLLLSMDVSPRVFKRLNLLADGKPWETPSYHFIYNYCYWRGVRRTVPDHDTWSRLATRGIPILMYHAFGKRGESASRFVVPQRRFALQMAWLKRAGYHVLGLEEYLRFRLEHLLPPARSLIITMDDGYAEVRSLAFPILQRYGFPATIFLISGKIGGTVNWDREGELVGRPLMGWQEIRDMLRGGITFGAHSRTHPEFRSLTLEQTRDEIKGARMDLEAELGKPIRTFAYPYGKYDATIRAVVEQAGYWGSCGVRDGLNTLKTSPYELRRIEIFGTDSLFRFVLKLWLGTNRPFSR